MATLSISMVQKIAVEVEGETESAVKQFTSWEITRNGEASAWIYNFDLFADKSSDRWEKATM